MNDMNELLNRKPVGQPSVPTLNFLVGDRSCNWKCKYCISKMTTNLPASSSPLYNTNFRLAFHVAEKFNARTVLITGKGEPTLWIDDVLNIVTEARMRGFITELQTNGSLLDNDTVQLLAHRGLNTVAISRVAFDVKENESICLGISPDLKKLCSDLKFWGINTRLSFLGMKGFNDTHRKIIETCKTAHELGVREVTIRRMGMPNLSVIEDSERATTVQNFVNENHVCGEDWEKVISSISQGEKLKWGRATLSGKLIGGADEFTPYPVLQVFDWGTAVWAIHGVSCAISDCLSIPGVQGSIRYLIYCPDGHMRYSWEYDQAIIF